MTWYLDTSAFVKLVQDEAESDALGRWLVGRAICSSDLLRTEARRVFIDSDAVIQTLLEGLLERTELIRLTPEVFDEAGLLQVAAPLRSLDAIHVIAARQLRADLEGIISYDRRLTVAAESLGILTVAPVP